jgi:hypothetical protein
MSEKPPRVAINGTFWSRPPTLHERYGEGCAGGDNCTLSEQLATLIDAVRNLRRD